MGEANGSLKAKNGHANGHSRGKPVQTHKRREASKKQRGFLGWIFNQIARYAATVNIYHQHVKKPKNTDRFRQASHMVRLADDRLPMPTDSRAVR